MNRNVFLTYIFMLSTLMVYAYGELREHFSEKGELKVTIKSLSHQLDQEKLKLLVTQTQLVEFQQEVATHLPEALRKKGKGAKGYPLRRLASIITQADAEKLQVKSSKFLFERAKTNFRNHKYTKAIPQFKKLIDHYSFSPHITEAYFLLSESQYQNKQYEDSLQVVSKMIQLFPSSELTGFSMLRMGKIYEDRYRKEDAVEIYKTVLQTFGEPQLIRQAKISLQAVNL